MSAAVDLYWLPLGAGERSVRFNGRVYEALAAWAAHRPARDLYHSALEVRVPEGRFVIEMTPAVAGDHGAVAGGAVGSRWAGRLRLFRYEIRRWRDGRIPDVREAVDSPRRLSGDEARARRLVALVPRVPALVWGRDELGAGDMWNSNSVVSWLLASSGLDVESIQPPPGGRAPGWRAGILAAGGSSRTHVERPAADVRACATGTRPSPARRAGSAGASIAVIRPPETVNPSTATGTPASVATRPAAPSTITGCVRRRVEK